MKDLFCAWKEKFHFKENVIFLFCFPSSTFFLSYMYVSANKNVDDSTGQNADVQIFLSRIQMLCQKYNSPKVLLSSFLFLIYTKPISIKKKKKESLDKWYIPLASQVSIGKFLPSRGTPVWGGAVFLGGSLSAGCEGVVGMRGRRGHGAFLLCLP